MANSPFGGEGTHGDSVASPGLFPQTTFNPHPDPLPPTKREESLLLINVQWPAVQHGTHSA